MHKFFDSIEHEIFYSQLQRMYKDSIPELSTKEDNLFKKTGKTCEAISEQDNEIFKLVNMQKVTGIREDHEFAECIEQWGWKYHHMGVPTEGKLPEESYIPHLKIYASGFQTSPFGIEWMQFDADCGIHPLIR